MLFHCSNGSTIEPQCYNIYINCLSCSSYLDYIEFAGAEFGISAPYSDFLLWLPFPVFCFQTVDFHRLLNSKITNRTCTTLDRYVNKYNLFTKLKFF